MVCPESSLPTPSKTDLEILEVLWDRPSATGREIYDLLLTTGKLRRRVAYTTVKTYLDRLAQKGYIRGDVIGDGRGTYLYTAVVTRETVRDHPDLLARLVRVFRLTPAEFIRWCAARDQIGPQDIADLSRLVNDLSAQYLSSRSQHSLRRSPYEPDHQTGLDAGGSRPLGNPWHG